MELAAEDEGIDFMFTMMTPLPPVRPDDPSFIESRMKIIGEIQRDARVPILFSSNTNLDVTDYARTLLHDNDVTLLPGVDLAMSSIGYLMDWIDQRDRVLKREPVESSPVVRADLPVGAWDELEARGLLAEHGVQTVPTHLATSADEAVEAASKLGVPVALKVCSRDILHKSDVGGVALGVSGESDVRAAFDSVLRSAREAVPGADIRGVLVSPMREPGLELLVGVTNDPTFGPVLTVGLGGIWVEVLKDSSLRVLPIARSEVTEMLEELKGVSLLKGGRGTKPVDLEALSHVILSIAQAALTLGPSLDALEVNPLRITQHGIEALDALVATGGEPR